MTLADSEGNEIEVGEPDGSKYTLELEPGTYRLSAYQKSGDEKTDMTGISGSGKSSLINEILYKTLACELNGARSRAGKCDG